jgi:signal transduction histidine kinase
MGVARRLAVCAAEPPQAILASAGFPDGVDEAAHAELRAGAAGEPTRAGFHLARLESVDGSTLGALGVWSPDAPPRLSELGKAISAVLVREHEHGALKLKLERADRLAMAGQLAAGLAHELGTPLTVVTGRARQIAAGTIAPEQVGEAARTIADQSERMTGIIRQVLDYARRRGPRPGRFDVRTVMRQCVSLLEPMASKRRVRLSFTDPGAPVVLSFDGSQLMQVLTNLVANGVAATTDGGSVSLSIEPAAERTPQPESGLVARRYAGLVVRDTGHGVSPEHAGRLFEPFFTTKQTGEGTGLGLSVAGSIVRDHEGWIGVESTRGVGTVFTVYLPV